MIIGRHGRMIGLRPRCDLKKTKTVGSAKAIIIAIGAPLTPSGGISSSEKPTKAIIAKTAPMMNGPRLSAYLTDLLIIR